MWIASWDGRVAWTGFPTAMQNHRDALAGNKKDAAAVRKVNALLHIEFCALPP
jgi:hypothetical protein